jgi:tetratricopeptide (TPR) repeat protein
MEETRFQEAQQAYAAGDYRSAAKGFLSAAGRGTDGNGAAYHMAGNSLLRLRRYNDAVTVFRHALRDEGYSRRGAVNANLGVAFVALGEYSEAVRAYEDALRETDYETPYKALQGMASALLERGRVEEAAAAYRKAALDTTNPEPAKALVNLGLCFMALGRPADAVDAYQAALGFDEYRGRGKALANLGQAYFTLGEYQNAVRAFEKATQVHSHGLSQAAGAAYEAALARVRELSAPRPSNEGPLTPDLPEGMPVEVAVHLSGESGSGTDAADDVELEQEAGAESSLSHETTADDASRALGFGDDQAVADFFSVSEEQLRERDLAERRARRAQTWSGRSRAVTVTVIVVVVLVCGAAVAAWFTGYGWPTQQQAVDGMLSAYGEGQPVDSFWVAVPAADVTREMAKVPVPGTYTIESVERSAQDSTVTVAVTPDEGTSLRYAVTLVREGVGWKINGVDNDW